MFILKRVTIFFGMIFSLFFINCDVQESFHSTEVQLSERVPEKIEVQKASAGILYMVSYDQSTATYSTRKPAALKADKTSDFVLKGYDKVRKTMTIDINGEVSITTEWLNGNADINMPLDLYNRVSDIQPALQEDPVVRSEMANGLIKYYSKSGEVKHEYPIKDEMLRINPEDFINNIRLARQKKDTDSRIEYNLDNLRQNGIQFDQLNKRFAQLFHSVEIKGEVIEQKQVLDLSLGKVIASYDMKPDGKLLRREFLKYNDSDALPILQNSMSESYGERDGQWKVINRNTIIRDNIQIAVNESLIGE